MHTQIVADNAVTSPLGAYSVRSHHRFPRSGTGQFMQSYRTGLVICTHSEEPLAIVVLHIVQRSASSESSIKRSRHFAWGLGFIN
jgi:hypothetical protein